MIQRTNELELHSDLSNEEALIAAVLIDCGRITEVNVGPGDFEDRDLGQLFGLVQAMQAAGEPTTGQNLINAIKTAGLSKKIGSPRLGQILASSNVQAAHAKHYAERLRKASTRRKLIAELSQSLTNINALPSGADLASQIEELRVVLDVLESRKSITIRSAVEIARENIADKQRGRSSPVFTGLSVFDEYWGGFCGGDLIVLAARTSIGKTALALGIAEYNARHCRPVLFITLEMRDSELIDRTLARLAGCSLVKLRNGRHGDNDDFRLTDEDFEKLNQAADSLEDVGLFVHDRPSIKTSGIRAAAKLTQARNGLSLLVVDMVNLVRPDDSRRDRHEQIGQITRDLKSLAKELDVPILLLAQINREAEKGNAEPSLIHLKESGSIEENADMVLLLHRADRMATEGKLIVAKNRHGQVNKMDLEFVGGEIQFRCRSNEWKP